MIVASSSASATPPIVAISSSGSTARPDEIAEYHMVAVLAASKCTSAAPRKHVEDIGELDVDVAADRAETDVTFDAGSPKVRRDAPVPALGGRGRSEKTLQ